MELNYYRPNYYKLKFALHDWRDINRKLASQNKFCRNVFAIMCLDLNQLAFEQL